MNVGFRMAATSSHVLEAWYKTASALNMVKSTVCSIEGSSRFMLPRWIPKMYSSFESDLMFLKFSEISFITLFAKISSFNVQFFVSTWASFCSISWLKLFL